MASDEIPDGDNIAPGVAPEPVSSTPNPTDTVVVSRGAGHRRAGKKKHRVLRGVITGVVSFVMVVGLAGAYWYRHLDNNLNAVDVNGQIIVKRPIDNGPAGALNILVMGSDDRDCSGCYIDGAAGGGSDTTILVHLSADRTRAYAVSIPRDSWVDRPKCETKNGGISPAVTGVIWNAAYSVGGPACTIAQTEQMTGIRIDHYVVVNFGGFKKMVDAVGGVSVCIPEDWNDKAHGIYLKAGTRKISGTQALNYVRIRHVPGSDGTDIGREKRQQAFIGSMIQTALSKGVLSNPLKLVKFLNAATASLQVDPGIGDIRQLGGLAYQFRSIGLNNIQFITTPWTYDGAPKGRVLWTPLATIMWHKLSLDEKLGSSFADGTIDVGNIPGLPTATNSASPTTTASGSASTTPTNSPSGSASGSTSPSGSSTPSLSDGSQEVFDNAGLCS